MLEGRCELFYGKSLERLRLSGVKTFQRSDTSEATSQADSQSLTGKILFLTTCDVMKFSETGHLQEVYLDLPVNLLRVLHVKRLECEKSMESIASFYHSCLLWSRWDGSAEVALLDFSPLGASRKAQ